MTAMMTGQMHRNQGLIAEGWEAGTTSPWMILQIFYAIGVVCGVCTITFRFPVGWQLFCTLQWGGFGAIAAYSDFTIGTNAIISSVDAHFTSEGQNPPPCIYLYS